MLTSLKVDLNSFVASLDPASKDALYRYLWADYVREDLYNRIVDLRLVDLAEEKHDEVVETAMRAYVYEGNYDCNLSYWENLDHLILDACKNLAYNQ